MIILRHICLFIIKPGFNEQIFRSEEIKKEICKIKKDPNYLSESKVKELREKIAQKKELRLNNQVQ